MASLFNKKKKLVFLASGRGSNMESVLRQIQNGQIKATPLAVISDKEDAKALDIGKKYGLEPICIPFHLFKHNRSEFDLKLRKKLLSLAPDLIVAAGYMKIIDSETIRTFQHKIMNIHPSLLPAFPGINAQKQAWEYGVKVTGCTVHFVDTGLDSGPIILQSPILIKEGMSERELNLSILEEEHRILPLAVKYFCENKIKINLRHVSIR